MKKLVLCRYIIYIIMHDYVYAGIMCVCWYHVCMLVCIRAVYRNFAMGGANLGYGKKRGGGSFVRASHAI